jgi:hypothetical protein
MATVLVTFGCGCGVAGAGVAVAVAVACSWSSERMLEDGGGVEAIPDTIKSLNKDEFPSGIDKM